MKRLTVLLVAALGLAASQAIAGDRLRLMQIPLEMPLEEELDGEYLEGIYQEKLLPELVDSVLYEAPIARIESTFSQDRKLKIWFTSNEDGRRAYWLQLDQSYPADKPRKSQALLDDFEAHYGKPDLVVGAIGGEPGTIIAVRVDPNMDQARIGPVLQALVASFKPDGDTLTRFWHMDMRQRARLLGPDFRGAILTFYNADGNAPSMTMEMLDLTLARSVLNLDIQ